MNNKTHTHIFTQTNRTNNHTTRYIQLSQNLDNSNIYDLVIYTIISQASDAYND
jgi:hypothetical protein